MPSDFQFRKSEGFYISGNELPMAKKRNKEPPQKWECISGHEHFTRLFDSLIHSPAYRVLSPVAAKTLVILKSEYKGNYTGNNIICP